MTMKGRAPFAPKAAIDRRCAPLGLAEASKIPRLSGML
jgi:hypothetical protein